GMLPVQAWTTENASTLRPSHAPNANTSVANASQMIAIRLLRARRSSARSRCPAARNASNTSSSIRAASDAVSARDGPDSPAWDCRSAVATTGLARAEASGQQHARRKRNAECRQRVLANLIACRFTDLSPAFRDAFAGVSQLVCELSPVVTKPGAETTCARTGLGGRFPRRVGNLAGRLAKFMSFVACICHVLLLDESA